MMQAHGHLDQPLKESPRRPLLVRPQVFPDLMSFVELTFIEVLNALDVTRIVLAFVGCQSNMTPSTLCEKQKTRRQADTSLGC